MLTCGIIGLPLAGKTTLFNLLTNGSAETSRFQTGKTEANVGTAWVPDQRIDWLSALFNPKKTTYAQVEYIDIPGLEPGAQVARGANSFLTSVREADSLLMVIRAFESPEVLHASGSADVLSDFGTVWAELFLSDLDGVEKRIARIESTRKRTKELDLELAALGKCREALENEKPIHGAPFTEDEKVVLKSFTFFTEKPLLVVVNVDEDQLRAGLYPEKQELEAMLAPMGIPVMTVCAEAEVEISQLEEADRDLFLSELGITESGIYKVSRAIYARLGLVSFFTTGEDEVRAWTIVSGTEAKPAAAKIHSDIERGFIRAEVVPYAVLHELGSVHKAREKGLYRLEGRDYPVQDGDIINFRFNA